MPAPSPEQVIPKALIKEAIPAAAAPGSVDSLAQKVSEKLDQGDWKEALKLRKKEAVKESKISEKIEQIGVERDATTGVKNRTPQEQARYNDAKAAAELAKKFVEKGYAAITPAEQTALQNFVLNETALRPALAAELSTLTPTQQKEYAERILKDPLFSAKAKEILSNLLSQEQLADSVTPAKDKFEEADLKRQEKEAEVTEVRARITDVDTALDSFKRDPTGVAIGTSAQELDRINGTLSTVLSELVALRQDLQDAQSKLQMLVAERANASRYTGGRPITEIDPDITTENAKIRTAQGAISTRETDLAKKTQLEQSEAKLKEDKKTSQREEQTKTAEFNKIKLETQKRARELADAQALRASQEQDLVDGFKNVFSEATSAAIDESVDKAEKSFTKELEDLKKKTDDQNEKAFYDGLSERYLGPQRRRFRGVFGAGRSETYRPISRGKVEADFRTLITEGPEDVMKGILENSNNPVTGVNYTPAEITTFISNTEYVSKLQPEVVKQLISKKILTGGLRPEDVNLIVNSRWGQGMLEQGIANNEEAKKAIEKIMGAGAVSQPGFGERLSQEVSKHPWWLISLLGIPLLLGGAAAMSAKDFNISE